MASYIMSSENRSGVKFAGLKKKYIGGNMFSEICFIIDYCNLLCKLKPG